MARETKAEREARELKEKQAADRAAKRAAAKEAANKPQVVVVDFSDETKSLLRALVEAINNKPAPVIAMPQATTGESSTKVNVAKQLVAQHPTKQLDLFPEEQAGKPTVSLTQIRELINLKAGDGKTASIVSLLKKHGAQNASSLEESKYDAFYNELKEI